MRKSIVFVKIFVIVWYAHLGRSYTLPPDFVLAEIVKFELPIQSVGFNGMMMKDGNASVVNFTLTKSHALMPKDQEKSLAWWELIELIAKHNVLLLRKFLSKAEIRAEMVSQGFFMNEPIFIIGSHPRDRDSPLIRVEKQSFLPVKLILKGKSITFEKWTGFFCQPKRKYPSIIKTTVGKNVETISMSEGLEKVQEDKCAPFK